MLPSAVILRSSTRLAGLLLFLLLAGLAFLLACFEMQDNDIWWHLRGGEWILQNRQTPNLDPFSFGSADQRWIDLHWLFQIIMATAHRAAGIAGVLLVTAAVTAAAFATALACRPAVAPLPVVVFAMLLGLALAAFRFDPRPEMFTLLFLSGFLAVLAHIEERPRLVWLLPALQLLWVNMHGLFIFGPLVLGLWWLAWAARRAGVRLFRLEQVPPVRPKATGHLAWASGAVLVCCLLNPYGLEGTLFPLKLYPKVAQAGNPYKTYIQEFMSPRSYASLAGKQTAGGERWFLSVFFFLLFVLPVSFLLPAVWKALRAEDDVKRQSAAKLRSWLLWLGVSLAVTILLSLQIPKLTGHDRVGFMVEIGNAMPLLLLGFASVAAWALRRCRAAALLCLVGGIAMAAWSAWLNSYMDSEEPSRWLLAVAGLAGGLTGGLIFRQTGDLFGMLLAGLFAYLALQAVNSFGRFGLVAGVLLSANLGGWVGHLLKKDAAARWRTGTAFLCRLGMIALLAGCVYGVTGGHYARWIGDPRQLRLREKPLTFAHEAACFAGQPDLPQRALVYDIAQSCVYVYHNAPNGKVFMDARLETPTPETFQRYIEIEKQLNKPGGRWPGLDQLGDVVIMLAHDGNIQREAALLSGPRWRCVYFDALAAVFVQANARERDRRFPTFDPAARHFQDPQAPSEPNTAGAAGEEADAAYQIGATLGRPGFGAREHQIPWLLLSLDRTQQALREDPESAAAWITRGNCFGMLLFDNERAPVGPHEDWDPTLSLGWAQSTFCFRQALERAPDNEIVLQTLLQSFGARRMIDAQRDIGARLLATGRLAREQAEAIRRLLDRVAPPINSPAGHGKELFDTAVRLLQSGRPIEATLLAEKVDQRGQTWTWPVADRLAGVFMHLGYPRKARLIWERAGGAPSEAVRLERLASTYWVEGESDEAVNLYRKSLAADPGHSETNWALAWLYAQRGDATFAHGACLQFKRTSPTSRLNEEISRLDRLLILSGGLEMRHK
ncbi:MAG: tetratricopeptide repeat protein [Gemmataceae bacterium]